MTGGPRRGPYATRGGARLPNRLRYSRADRGVMGVRFLVAAWMVGVVCGLSLAAQTPSAGHDHAPAVPAPSAGPAARPDLVREPSSAADVAFMAGMIPHHAQAVRDVSLPSG